MALTEEVIKELNQAQPTMFHERLLQHCKRLVEMSRKEMRKNYDAWDRQDETYQGAINPDKEDKKAAQRKEPIKSVMPVTKSQIDTFVAFGFSVYFQRDTFFELTPFGSDNVKAAATGESLLQRDLDYSNVQVRLFQFLLDVGRFGLGVLKNSWVEETQRVMQEVQQPQGELLGVETQPETVMQETVVTKYQGNRVTSVSPYRFFPDPRYPISELQQGEFCASEDEMEVTKLRSLEADGCIAGLAHIKEMNAKASAGRSTDVRSRFARISNKMEVGDPISAAGVTIITEMVVKLIPSEWVMDSGSPLGSETRPVKYLVWYANDNRIVRIEPFTYTHDEFPFFAGQMCPDMHHLVSQGIAGTLEQLQNIISWFINSHITSVRKVIQNRLLVDPTALRMEDITEKRPVIRTLPGKARNGFDSILKQLDLQDVTTNHVKDAAAMHEMAQLSTGLSENALGQFHQGRRSAREAQAVNSSIAGRLKTSFAVLYYSALEPLGRQMLNNLREGLSMETYVRLFGVMEDPIKYFDFVKVNKADLVGDYDFEIFDGTLPTEKAARAQTIQETLLALLQAPDLIVMLGLDIREMFFELMRLRGVRHPERFKMGFDQQVLLAKLLGGVQQQQQPQQQQPNGQPQSTNGSPVQGNGTRAAAQPAQGVGGQSLLALLQGGVGAGR